MKRFIALMMATIMCLSLVACGQSGAGAESKEPPAASQEAVPAEPETPEEVKPNYAEIIPGELQGVWGDGGVEGILSLYAFKGNKVDTFVVNFGIDAANVLSGTYTVEDGKVKYDFGNSTGYSNFTYDDNVLAMSNANGVEIKKLSAADIMDYLTQEENSANNSGVICLADLIVNYYSDSDESSAAAEKKDAANSAIKAAGEAALQNLKTDYDKVEKLTWYEHKNQPKYTDICCYIYPYIGRMDSGNTLLRVIVNYTDAKTDAGWIFFEKVIFSVDGENTTKYFSRNELVRDNDTEVWEFADFEPTASEVQLLKSIANSTETIIRFEGDDYYEDHIVTSKEKAAILDVLTAYDYLVNYSE
jgi:predicted small lipoprotein YifL